MCRPPRLRVPPLSFVRERLREHGGMGFDEVALAELAADRRSVRTAWDHWCEGVPQPGLPIMCLARISSRGCAHACGPLAAWHRESMLQLMMFDYPADAYDIVVEDVAEVSAATCLEMKRRIMGSRWQPATPKADKPLFLGMWDDSGTAAAGGIGISNPCSTCNMRMRIFPNGCG